MKTIIVGLGNQGNKRKKILIDKCVATVDPFVKKADYKNIKDVPEEIYDAVLVCTPDELKFKTIKYFITNKKHVLVEKPLFFNTSKKINILQKLANKNKVVLYTAYNHRFEPHFRRLKKLIDSKKLGKIYSCRLFYGNGTAQQVRKDKWRDRGSGVIKDLGSHLLDTYNFFFNNFEDFELTSYNCFENRAPDHAVFKSKKKFPLIQLEMTFCMWKNFFSCDILAEKGTAHIFSLCKWGPSKFVQRTRRSPYSKPYEKQKILIQKDPTWKNEYKHFKSLVKNKKKNILQKDIWINNQLLKFKK